MGEAYILRRGSGGIPGNWAVIVARVPSGATVTATKDGITLTPKMWVSEADPTKDIAIFALTPAQFDADTPWTITATGGGSTASTTVLVTANKEYEVELAARVPPEYQAVEYLETASTSCYFDTGVSAVNNNIKVDTHIAVATTSGSPYVFGIANRYAAQVLNQYSSWLFYYYPNSDYDGVYNKYDSVVGTKYHLIYNSTPNGDVVLNDETVATGKTRKAPDGYTDTILIAGNRFGHNISNYGAWRYEDFIVADNGTGEIYADLRPCYRKADSVIGFWDDVQKVFRTNLGAASPTVGPDIN